MSLTEAGERFLAQAGPALKQITDAMDDLRSYTRKPSGLLRINVPRSVYPTYLAPVLASFNETFPEITVELCFEESPAQMTAESAQVGYPSTTASPTVSSERGPHGVWLAMLRNLDPIYSLLPSTTLRRAL